MFTGIVQNVGKIVFSQVLNQALSLEIEGVLPRDSFELGASVSVNGACLTIISADFLQNNETSILPGWACCRFRVQVGKQTLDLTTLASLKFGDPVNLEAAVKLGQALGGHVVTGHVDFLAEVVDVKSHTVESHEVKDGQKNTDDLEPKWISVKLPIEKKEYCIEKGSVALKGVSLTIAKKTVDVNSIVIGIMLIPHTLKSTVLSNLLPGDKIEVELDRDVKVIVDTVKTVTQDYLKSHFKLTSKEV